MPPSPSMRRSPRGDPCGDSHKRGRSLESGLSFKEKDDDLTLFNEMQSRERENFLLEPTDDFEDLLSSKMRPFADFKLGVNIPARGESSDLLNADGDKNDYEWLLTPPDTPLFPSLDDEPSTVNLVHNGRARSRPISLSRSSTMEKSQRSSRGSPSPQRLSPSPRSGTSTFRGRPSSAPHSNPAPLHSSSPSRRPSPPPVKPSTPPPRSLTPTSRRATSGAASSVAMPGIRGTSPVRTSRGNSASPKVKAWQSNIPGFSLEAPPNLRTSLADRPASYVRGSSPASRTSRDSSSKYGRQSMSPTASRSISSSHSQERDRVSSHSKGSIASSGDDDADSLQSVPVSVSDHPTSRKGVSGYSSGRPVAFSKKPSKTFSPSSAPKRSFDSAMRQLDRKGPQNMFRPLLSSVPSSTFYSGTSSAHRTLISRNSSVTTSSNASSDLATSAAHDTEGSDQYHDDMASDCARATFSDIHDEVFVFDKMDAGPEDAGHEGDDALSEALLGDVDKGQRFASNPGDTVESSHRYHSRETDQFDVQGDVVIVDSYGNSLICSICGNRYLPDEVVESNNNICLECKRKESARSSALLNRLKTTQSSSVPLMDNSEESHVVEPVLNLLQLEMAKGDAKSRDVSEIALCPEGTTVALQHQSQPSQSCLENPLSVSTEAGIIDDISKEQVTREHKSLDNPSHSSNSSLERKKHSGDTDTNISVAEGAGISVLLSRSSSVKGPIVHGRTINSSAISFEDLSYARDLTSSMRSSVGHGSFSASSSIDLTSSRHAEVFVRRQLSGKLSDSSSKPQSAVSSFSGASVPVYQGFGLSTSSHEGSFEGSLSNLRHSVAGERSTSSSDQLVAFDNSELRNAGPSVARVRTIEAENFDICMSSQEKDPSLMAGCMQNIEVENMSQDFVGVGETDDLLDIDEHRQKRIGHIQDVTQSELAESSLAEGGAVSENRVSQVDVAEDLPQCSLSTMSEIEINDSHPSSPRSQIDVFREDLEDSSAAMQLDIDDVKDAFLESAEPDHTDLIAEESTVSMEDQGGTRTRSLTLEEATDTILFCNSIIHDLAYKAATIAIEREKENLEPLEGSRPTVTIPEKSTRGFTTGRTPKTQKAARKRRTTETEAKPPLTQNDERSNEPVVRNVGLPNNGDITKQPPKLESKCNCTIM